MSAQPPTLQDHIEAAKVTESRTTLAPTLEERSRRLALACRAAAAIARDRRRAGLPEPVPEPWPTSPGSFSPSMADRERNLPADPDSYQVAEELACRLDAVHCEYALGDAIALGFWSEPRGTLDVDVTLYLPLIIRMGACGSSKRSVVSLIVAQSRRC